eukprot:m.22405 g.22405  ORF g.22405 m.22405 type:complete len:106 (+) comp3983_c0_seq1:46-363(+)
MGDVAQNGMGQAAAPMETDRMTGMPPNMAANATTEQEMATSTAPDIRTIPVRQYLDKTVVPVLNEGLAELSKTRPDQPVEWLAAYLLKNKDRYPPTLNAQPSASS